MRNLRILSLLLIACSCAPTLHVKADVDCPVLGREHKLAQDSKEWLLERPAPESLTKFINEIGDHNEKVRVICQAKE